MLTLSIKTLFSPSNMEKYLFLFPFLFFASFVHGQDVIITTRGDTIHCAILKVNESSIDYSLSTEQAVEYKTIPFSEVAKYQYIFSGKNKPAESKKTIPGYKKFRLGLCGGYGYRTASISDQVGDLESYFEALKSGFTIEANVAFFFNKKYGVGLRYDFFHSKSSMDNIVFEFDDGHTEIGSMSDDIKINYIGPCFQFRVYNKPENLVFQFGMSAGYMNYIDKAAILDQKFRITGGTLGFAFMIGMDWHLAENLALTLGFSLDMGSLKKIDIDDGSTKTTVELDVGNAESLTKVNVTVGLSFWK